MGGGPSIAPVVFYEPEVSQTLQAEADARYGKLAGEEDALDWASDSTDWTEAVRRRDTERLREAGTIERLASGLQDATRTTRLSAERIDAVCEMVPGLTNNSDYQALRAKLLALATNGMEVRTPRAFRPNGKPPDMGEKEERMQPAICKLLLKPHDKKFVLLVDEEEMAAEALRSGMTSNYLGTGWASSSNKREGRITIDPSHTQPESASLNLPKRETRSIGEEQYGHHPLPTLRDIIMMIVAAERDFGIDLTLMKLDMQGAFHLLNFSPDSVRLMCSRLRGGLVLLWLVGNFGHCHTPPAVAVLSAFLEMTVNELGLQEGYRFLLKIYVDDLMAAVRHSHAPRVQQLLEQVMCLLLGDSAVATEKTETGRSLTLIGWDVDLDRRSVTMARKTLLKAVYLFNSVRDGAIAFRDMEVLAALTERFSGVAPELSGFKSYLYGAYKWRNRHSRITLDDTCLTALRICQSLVARHLSDPGSRHSFDSLLPRPASWVVEYDGSIYGIGGRVFELVDGEEVLRLCVSLDLTEGISSHPSRTLIQNGCELLAASVTTAALISLGVRGAGLLLRGDSIVSGSWLAKGHYTSPFSKNSSLLWLSLQESCGLSIESWVHLPKEVNTTCDDYSRGIRPTTLACSPGVDVLLGQLVIFCNPIASTAHFESLPSLNLFLSNLAITLSSLARNC